MGAAEKLTEEVMALPASERATLARRLLVSLDEGADTAAEAEEAGQAEALRRLAEIDRGDVKPLSQDDLFRRVQRRLGR